MALNLYNLTLETGGAVNCACAGSFSAPKRYEIVCGRGQHLELLHQDGPESPHLESISLQHIFGLVRCVKPFRLHGANRDYLIVTSDSGRIVILEFDAVKKEWTKVHQETYGKTGCRRAVPGEYLATDPRGRTVMVGAIEKQKFVYVLNRDSDAKITISSPLEAHKSNTITYCIVGLDVGYDNPIFAAIEVDHSELDEDPQVEQAEKHLVFYELDLGLNHVVRKCPWADQPLDPTAHMLFAVPGGDDGPGGCLVCIDNYLVYMNPGHDTLKEVIPRRQDMLPTTGLMIVSGALHKQSKNYFFLLQSEYGDLYKVTLSTSQQKDIVHQINIRYFDTVPVANSIMIMRSGYLFAASEFSNHKFYHFEGLGDDDDDSIIGAMTITQAGGEHKEILPLFNPRKLRNLVLVEEIESLSPLIDLKVYDSAADIEGKRLFALCGRGPQSTLRVLQHGLSLATLAASELQGTPEKVWTIRRSFAGKLDDYIVISFTNATIVLCIGDNTVQEVHDSGFFGQTSTLVCKTLIDDTLLQVCQTRIRHIRSGNRISEWKAPGNASILRAEANEKQVVISLGGGELVYFELDQSTSTLNEVCKKDLDAEILSLAIGPIPEGRVRSRFLGVGFTNRRVHVLSLDPDDGLATLARQGCSSEPEDIKIVSMETETVDREENLCMYIGCANGILIRSVLDRVSGEIADARTRFCGTRPCRLVTTQVSGKSAVMVLSSRSWLAYFYQNKYHLSPLSCCPFTHASSFASEQCPEGVVTVAGNTVAILAFERLGGCFNQTPVNLKATPRAFTKHPLYNYLIMIETEHRAYTDEEKQSIRAKLKASIQSDDPGQEEEELPEKDYGTIKAQQGKWCSYLRIFDPQLMVTHDLIELEENQAAVSVSTVVFHDTGGEVYLVVGTVKDFIPNPNCYSSGMLLTFRFLEQGRVLDLVHKTIIDGIPKALHPFQGRLFVGVNNKVRIYDLGKMKLLRKCENKQLPNMVVKITSHGNRIFVGDITDSVHVMKYRKHDNHLSVFADDTLPRWTTAIAVLDHSTVAIGDKLGNINVLRLEENVSEDMDNDPNCPQGSTKWLWDRGFLNGAPQRLQVVASYFVGTGITSMDKVCLTTGGEEVLLYTTLNGTIGCMIPVTKKHDAEMLKLLEMHLRQELPPLCGRDHLAFRSYYTPQRCVIDGDYVELFSTLPVSSQNQIANELGKMPNEIAKRLEEIRNRIL